MEEAIRFNLAFALALCSRAWGILPGRLNALVETGEVSLQDIMRQIRIEKLEHPESAEEIHEAVWPGWRRQRLAERAAATNGQAFERLKEMKNRQKRTQA